MNNELINRQAALYSITAEYNRRLPADGLKLAYIEKALNEVKGFEPTATIKMIGGNLENCECSLCRNHVHGWDKYCKHCGAKLEVVENVSKDYKDISKTINQLISLKSYCYDLAEHDIIFLQDADALDHAIKILETFRNKGE